MKLNFLLFFIVYQVAVFRTFSIVLSCSFAERTEATHQLLLFIQSSSSYQKLLEKKKSFILVIPNLIREIAFTQSSFIPQHQISPRTVEITNVRSLIYTKKLKAFPQPVKSLNLWKNINFRLYSA